jgi:hypothetical protein
MSRIARRWRSHVAIVAGVLGVPLAFRLGAQADDTRAIVPEAFLSARPVASSKSTDKPVYRRVGPSTPSSGSSTTSIEIGVTLWRLRPARATDPSRLLLHEGAQNLELTPVRVRLDERLATGDRVRLTLESPRDGYLYVVDSEQYADGSMGPPYLIFPTKRTRGGDNKVAAGRIVDIPAQDDAPPYLTMRPSRPDQVGERLTIVVVREPIGDVSIGPSPARLERRQVVEWEKRGGGTIQRFEMQSGAGQAWSVAERAASDGTRRLTREDPPPQTLFRIQTADPALVALPVVLSSAGPSAGRSSTGR